MALTCNICTMLVMQLDRLGYLYVQIRQISHCETFLAYLHCKEIKVPSLIVERLSGAFHLQPITCPVVFSSVRSGSILNG